MRNALYYLCLLVCGILPLAAQPDPDDRPRKNTGRTAWFACIALPEGFKNPVMAMGGEDLTKIELSSYMTSDPVKIPADGIIRMVREIPDPNEPGKTKHLVLAMAKIPESMQEALVILAPLPKSEGDLIFTTKIQNLATFKGGDRLFINLSDTQIGVKIGADAVAVPAKQAIIYSSPKLAEPANMPITYNYYHPEQKKWKLLTASTVVIMPTRREICVFNNGSRPGNIKKHGILFPVQSEKP